MTDQQGISGHDAASVTARLRERSLGDLHDDCLPLTHFDYVAGQMAPADPLSARQRVLLDVIRALLEDELMVVGGIVGGSDEHVDPWDMSLADAMAQSHDCYVVHHDDQGWVFRTWFALTDGGERAAQALEAKKSEG
jgi:hypothetical protein